MRLSQFLFENGMGNPYAYLVEMDIPSDNKYAETRKVILDFILQQNKAVLGKENLTMNDFLTTKSNYILLSNKNAESISDSFSKITDSKVTINVTPIIANKLPKNSKEYQILRKYNLLK